MFLHRANKALFLLCFLLYTQQAEQCETIGAVVNYEPTWDNSRDFNTNIFKNAHAYCAFIKQASKAQADIIVFPADGLQGASEKRALTSITDINNSTSKDAEDKVLSVLSTCTKESKIYVVLTLTELVNNTHCTTQIALDRSGKIVARNGATQCRSNSNIEQAIFKIDTGHNVALMLNDDVFLEERTQKLKKLNVSYYALSYDLLASLPFSTGVQTQWWWSYAEDRMLLAAGLNENGRSGSGIYIGKLLGPVQAEDGSQPGDSLLLHRLPNCTGLNPYDVIYDEIVKALESYTIESKVKRSARVGNRRERRDATAYVEAYAHADKRELKEELNENLDNYTKLLMNVDKMILKREKHYYVMQEKLCSGGLCCDFKLKWHLRLDKPQSHHKKRSNEETKPVQFGHDEDTDGCYILTVGNMKEDLGGLGAGNVKRCAIVYTRSKKYCRIAESSPVKTTLLQDGDSSSSSSSGTDDEGNSEQIETKHKENNQNLLNRIKKESRKSQSDNTNLTRNQILNRENSVLHNIQIIANERQLTPNVLLQNGFELVPHVKAFTYSDFPFSKLNVKKTFHKFITLGVQKITNYTVY